MPETIGEIIRKLREERNMSQIGLAWAANVRGSIYFTHTNIRFIMDP